MIIRDIYGNFEITNSLLVDLIMSTEVQRLRDINQQGIPQQFSDFPQFDRYQHSLGVMLLTRKVGGTLEQQVAALIHDVSHTAFSHLADFVFGSEAGEDYQDRTHRDFVKASSIPRIVSKHNIDLELVINPEEYPIVDSPIPN